MLAEVVTADDLGAGIGGKGVGREDPEPGPLLAGVGVFGLEGVGKVNTGEVLGAVEIEPGAGDGQLLTEIGHE